VSGKSNGDARACLRRQGSPIFSGKGKYHAVHPTHRCALGERPAPSGGGSHLARIGLRGCRLRHRRHHGGHGKYSPVGRRGRGRLGPVLQRPSRYPVLEDPVTAVIFRLAPMVLLLAMGAGFSVIAEDATHRDIIDSIEAHSSLWQAHAAVVEFLLHVIAFTLSFFSGVYTWRMIIVFKNQSRVW